MLHTLGYFARGIRPYCSKKRLSLPAFSFSLPLLMRIVYLFAILSMAMHLVREEVELISLIPHE